MSSSSHPKLVWPRSDGSSERWPKAHEPGSSGWNVHLPLDHAKQKLYNEKVGRHLATEVLGLKGMVNPSIPLPSGYALFGHNKPQADGSIREDVYLFGSELVNKFRSPQEFFPHAEWLFDTSRSLNDHSKCGCKYNSKSSLALERKMASGSTGSVKRPSSDDNGESKRLKATSETQVDYDGVVPERAKDHRMKRRFRKGELVFFRIPTIEPPSKSDFPPITHWPGLVSSIKNKRDVHHINGNKLDGGSTAGASSSVAWSLFGGVPPAQLVETAVTTETFEHSIRPLGMFTSAHELWRPTSDLLPWAAGDELLGGSQGWDIIGRESTQLLRDGVLKEAKEDPPKTPGDLDSKPLEERWKMRWGERIRFTEMPRNWLAAALRLGVALQTAKMITNSWCQTDKIEVIPPGSEVSQDDILAIQNHTKTLYQGVWWQGERIWLEDMVRLKKLRSDLPTDLLAPPSEGANDHAVFLTVKLITVESFMLDSAADADTFQWRCLFYGDLYELSSRPPAESEPIVETTAPPGRYYRRINSVGTEVTIDILDVGGRCYPDLLHKEAGYLIDPNAEDKDSSRVSAGDSVMALVGLRPASMTASTAEWKDDLYAIVRDASIEVERKIREHYAHLLKTTMGWAEFPPTPITATPVPAMTHTNGHES